MQEQTTDPPTEEVVDLGRPYPLDITSRTLALIDGDRPCQTPFSRLEIPEEGSYWE